MTYPSARFLTDAGVLRGHVITTARPKLALTILRQKPGDVVVHVPDAGQQGHLWIMDVDDAERMKAEGYPVINLADFQK